MPFANKKKIILLSSEAGTDDRDTLSEQLFDKLYAEFCVDNRNNLFAPRLYYQVLKYDSLDKLKTDTDSKFIDAKKDLLVVVLSDSAVHWDCEQHNDLFENFTSRLVYSVTPNGVKFLPSYNVININNISSEVDIQLEMISCNIAYKLLCKKHQKKCKIFLSYARLDGTALIENVKAIIKSLSNFEIFIDTKSIACGGIVQDEIDSELAESYILAVITDSYATRYWCTHEILTAKKAQRPIVYLDCITLGEVRKNPNMANAPSIKYYEHSSLCVFTAIKSLLIEGLKRDRYYKEVANETKHLWNAPELSSLTDSGITKIIYPEPPISAAELKYYNSYYNKIEFKTNIAAAKFNNPNQKVCISSSNQSMEEKLHPNLPKDSFIELCRHLIINNVKVLYGGDWRTSGYTNSIKQMLESYGSINDASRFINYYAPKTANENLDSILADAFNVIGVNIINTDNDQPTAEESYAKRLTEMRKKMIGDANALIAIGGNTKVGSSITLGIVEEVAMAISNHKQVYLVGGFGGATKQIVDAIKNDNKLKAINNNLFSNAYSDAVEKLVDIINKCTVNNIADGNRLTQEENQQLFISNDIEEIVKLILKGLGNSQ